MFHYYSNFPNTKKVFIVDSKVFMNINITFSDSEKTKISLFQVNDKIIFFMIKIEISK